MKEQSPLKRVEELKAFSKDHHHGLLLGWKIRTGLKKNIGVKRISAYIEWFYQNHLLPHFELEEKYVFPILGRNDALIQRAYVEHREIHLTMAVGFNEETLIKFADLLGAHIRFEERVLFHEIQAVATKEQLFIIHQIHHDIPFTEFRDEFWK